MKFGDKNKVKECLDKDVRDTEDITLKNMKSSLKKFEVVMVLEFWGIWTILNCLTCFFVTKCQQRANGRFVFGFSLKLTHFKSTVTVQSAVWVALEDNQSILKFFLGVKTRRWVSLAGAWQLVRVDVQIPSRHWLSWIEPQIS